jgi:lipopolysaccharide transport system ATP-binding protein
MGKRSFVLNMDSLLRQIEDPTREVAERTAFRRGRWSSVRVGVWGTFDLENFGDMLFPPIVRRELLRRLPEASVRMFGPYGYLRPVSWDGGQPAEPLGPWCRERVTELARDLDCVLVGGGEIIHTRDELLAPHYGVEPDEILERAPSRYFIEGLGADLESECPVLWNAVGIPFDLGPEEATRVRAALSRRPYIAVRDELSKRRLEAAGVEREIDVVPDPGLLLPRLFSPGLLDKRLAFLRLMGWYPPSGRPIVLQGNRDLVRFVPALVPAVSRLVEELGETSIVVAETGPCHGDAQFADALAEALPFPFYRLPAKVGMEDLVTAIASSGGFVGISLHGNITAFVYGRPHVILNLNGQSKLDGLAALIGGEECLVHDPTEVPGAFQRASARALRQDLVAVLQSRVDAHFDRVATIAEGSAGSRRAGGPDLRLAELDRRLAEVRGYAAALERALEVRGQRLVLERLAFADHVQDLRDEHWKQLQEERERLEAEIDALRREVRGKHEWLVGLMHTKTFRYTAPFRAVYGRLRRWLLR